MTWALLVLAIASEVTATLSLRASEGLRRRRWIPVLVVGYVLAFSLLGAVLAMGMPVGVAYGVWAAAGVAISPKQEDFAWIGWIGQGPHATKGTSAVMEGMGRDRDRGFGKRHTLATKPGVGKELVHGGVSDAPIFSLQQAGWGHASIGSGSRGIRRRECGGVCGATCRSRLAPQQC